MQSLVKEIATSFTGAFDALLNAYQKLGNTMPIFSAIEDAFTSNLLVQGTLVQVYRDILAFHSRALRFFRKKGRLTFQYVKMYYASDAAEFRLANCP